jgi:hypothetical protein
MSVAGKRMGANSNAREFECARKQVRAKTNAREFDSSRPRIHLRDMHPYDCACAEGDCCVA